MGVARVEGEPVPDKGLSEHGVWISRAAFTPEECRKIVDTFVDKCSSGLHEDSRADMGVKRINRPDVGGAVRASGEFDWIYERVLERAREVAGDAPWGFDIDLLAPQTFRSHVEFDLLHEFQKGYFFDFHIDAKPNDNTQRSINVNVMLSPREDYTGGGLQVGAAQINAEQGDLYFYPAAFPHKVHDVTGGVRHTLVIATKADGAAQVAAKVEDLRTAYWQAALNNHQALENGYAKRASVEDGAAKLLWIQGEFLDSAGYTDAADRLFALSYAATPEKDQYAAKFYEDGVAAGQLAAAQPGAREAAIKFFNMALMVDPAHEAARAALGYAQSLPPVVAT